MSYLRIKPKLIFVAGILTEGATPEEARAWGGKGWETLKDYIIIES